MKLSTNECITFAVHKEFYWIIFTNVYFRKMSSAYPKFGKHISAGIPLAGFLPRPKTPWQTLFLSRIRSWISLADEIPLVAIAMIDFWSQVYKHGSNTRSQWLIDQIKSHLLRNEALKIIFRFPFLFCAVHSIHNRWHILLVTPLLSNWLLQVHQDVYSIIFQCNQTTTYWIFPD